METMLHLLSGTNPWLNDFSVGSTVVTLLMAFVLGQAIAWIYRFSHTGLSYSQSFTQSLMLMTMIVSLVMHVIGNSLVTAFGLLGALALIRFRNVLKDTLDTVFVFISLVVGMGVGSQRYLTAIIGTITMVLVILYIKWTSFGSMGRYDGYLTWSMARADGRDDPATPVWDLLDRFCGRAQLISTTQTGEDDGSEFVYQVGLRDRDRSGELVVELQRLTGVRHVSFVMRSELSEV